MDHDWEMRVQPAPWWGGVECVIRRDFGGIGVEYVEDFITTEVDLSVKPPSFCLEMRAAQVLMDDLWASGVRPSEKRQSGEAIAAMQAHLEDMRRLVFAKLEAFMPTKG